MRDRKEGEKKKKKKKKERNQERFLSPFVSGVLSFEKILFDKEKSLSLSTSTDIAGHLLRRPTQTASFIIVDSAQTAPTIRVLIGDRPLRKFPQKGISFPSPREAQSPRRSIRRRLRIRSVAIGLCFLGHLPSSREELSAERGERRKSLNLT